MRRRVRRWAAGVLLALLSLGLALGLGMAALDRLFPPALGRLADLSPAVLDRDGRPLRLFLNGEGAWRLPVSDQEPADPLLVRLLLAYEDRRFRDHAGVDPLALLRAAGQNAASGRVVSGASTITMQVARLLEPHPRSLTGKLRDMLRALQLEARFDKRTILSFYLTLAPYGGNLEGVRAATRAYFGKEPQELTVGEAALLVALPQSPTALRPDRFPERARAARAKVLERAVAAGALTPAQAREGNEEPVPASRAPAPMDAAHLAERLVRAHPGQAVIRTTIDGPLQRAVQDLARAEAAGLHERAGLAILVVDNATRAVLAAVGGPDPLDDRRQGWVDLLHARRSPGSALKPFVYGLGFHDGLIHPETLVADVSTRFGDYAPRNFDRDFDGDLTIREALQRSLNVPAVAVLDRVGPVRFAAALERCGVRLTLPRGTAVPGLPLALGGVAVDLWDMTALYAGLANGGRVAPLRALDDGALRTGGVPLMAPAAAAQVLRILEGAAPPAGVVQAQEVRRRRPVALKTGTSFGFRDAWAFGVSGRYTVGVWSGRPDGTPLPGHYGRNTAAPILFRVLDRLPPEPGGAAAAAMAQAPDLLRRLNREEGEPPPAGADPPRLVFPLDAATVERAGEDEPVILSAAGGRRPLTWLVDGRRIATTPVARDVPWHPDGPGFARITVVDADGRSDSVGVEVR